MKYILGGLQKPKNSGQRVLQEVETWIKERLNPTNPKPKPLNPKPLNPKPETPRIAEIPDALLETASGCLQDTETSEV